MTGSSPLDRLTTVELETKINELRRALDTARGPSHRAQILDELARYVRARALRERRKEAPSP